MLTRVPASLGHIETLALVTWSNETELGLRACGDKHNRFIVTHSSTMGDSAERNIPRVTRDWR